MAEREGRYHSPSFDVDIIDSEEFPLANSPHYAGLTAAGATSVLGDRLD